MKHYRAGAGPFPDLVQQQLVAVTAANGGNPVDRQTVLNVCYSEYTRMQRDQHRGAFPFNANMCGLTMIIQAELTEPQRERFMSILTMRNLDISDFNVTQVRGVFMDLLCTSRSSMENPQLRASGPEVRSSS